VQNTFAEASAVISSHLQKKSNTIGLLQKESFMKNAICLSLLVAFLTIGITHSTYGQTREPITIQIKGLTLTAWSNDPDTSQYYTGNYEVPPGKRFVIEQVFLEIAQKTTTAKIHGRLRLVSTVNGGSVAVPLQLKYSTDHFGRVLYSTSEFTKVSVTSLSNGWAWVDFYLYAGTNQSSSLVLNAATVSGYLEDLP
jgi:hypothetical protein